MRYIIIILLLGVGMLANTATAETRLMMVEEDNCPWCARWNADVGDVYAITAEGEIAPLMRQDIHLAIPEGIVLKSPPHYTPTFILLVDGGEVSRIEGYPGEDFFWGLLGMMLEDLQKSEQVLSDL